MRTRTKYAQNLLLCSKVVVTTRVWSIDSPNNERSCCNILFENESLDSAFTNGDLGFRVPNKFGCETFETLPLATTYTCPNCIPFLVNSPLLCIVDMWIILEHL